MRADPLRRRAGFSLVEVAASLGIISFGLVALLGVFPLGLDNSRQSVSETRATQLVKMIVSTLESEPFEAADCFRITTSSANQAPRLDLRTLPARTPPAIEGQIVFSTAPDVVLHASYDILDLPRVIRLNAGAAPPADAIYRIELRFAPQSAPYGPSATVPARLAGSLVDLRLYPAGGKETCIGEAQAFIPNFSRVAYSAP